MDAYVPAASPDDPSSKTTIKPGEMVGGILGTAETPPDYSLVMVELRLKNLSKEDAKFALDDMTLKWPGGSATPGAFATGPESAAPSQVPVAMIGAASTFTIPTMTTHNIEFSVAPSSETVVRFYFSTPRKGTDLSLVFGSLKPVKVARGPAQIPGEKKK